MRINYFSDIHLEFGALEVPENEADVIIAAGDIGIYNQGLEWLKKTRKPVIYIAGNHELYSNEYLDTMKNIRSKCAGSRVHFLENNTFVYKNVRFLGCTLWTDLFAEGGEKAITLGKKLNDFNQIHYGEGLFNIHRYSQAYHRSRFWLEKELAQPFDGKTVVVTHHAPLMWSWNHATNEIKKLAYCNNLKQLFQDYQIDLWVHGHTHSISDYKLENARIVCNPRGYAGMRTVEKFDLNRIVEI